jgi:uncharacterized lipoprotein NlpE involved in copper resistance
MKAIYLAILASLAILVSCNSTKQIQIGYILNQDLLTSHESYNESGGDQNVEPCVDLFAKETPISVLARGTTEASRTHMTNVNANMVSHTAGYTLFVYILAALCIAGCSSTPQTKSSSNKIELESCIGWLHGNCFAVKKPNILNGSSRPLVAGQTISNYS